MKICLPVKLKKTAVQQPLPPKTAIFRRKLTFSGHTRRIFNDNDPIFFLILRIECAYTENRKNGGSPAAAAENRHLNKLKKKLGRYLQNCAWYGFL